MIVAKKCPSFGPYKHKPSLLRRSFSTGVSLQNLDKSICINSGIDGLDYFDDIAKLTQYGPIVDLRSY